MGCVLWLVAGEMVAVGRGGSAAVGCVVYWCGVRTRRAHASHLVREMRWELWSAVGVSHEVCA